MAVRQGHQMREWIVFFLHGVKETAESSIDVFRQISKLKERIERVAREVLQRFSHPRQDIAQRLMIYLYEKPVIDIKKVCALLNTVPNTASALVSDLVKHKVLKEVTGQQRNRLFVFF